MTARPRPPIHSPVDFSLCLQQATLDAFETLSLGPSAPTMPGQAPDGGANPAAFPRPAGPTAEAHVGPPEPYSPVNCKPEFVRMTSCTVPNSQVCVCVCVCVGQAVALHVAGLDCTVCGGGCCWPGLCLHAAQLLCGGWQVAAAPPHAQLACYLSYLC